MSEDLLASAVQFLQDPKVADAPLTKRIAFLESKGLSQDQVQIALQRAQEVKAAGGSSSGSSAGSTYTNNGTSTGYAPAVPPASYGSGAYSMQPFQQQQQAPPPLPQRDWRDWFIMAVVSGGFSWALYFLAKRYVVPLVQPPTQSQLEEDKAELAKQFDQVQEMLNILQQDTTAMKDAATKQQERLDGAITDVETIVTDVKEKSARREVDVRRMGLEIDQIREMIPKAIDGVKQSQEASLNELHNELKSLKTLLTNRLKAQPASFQTAAAKSGALPSSSSTPSAATTTAAASSSSQDAAGSTATNGTTAGTTAPTTNGSASSGSGSGSGSGIDLSRFSSQRGGSIPAWQLAATEKPAAAESATADAAGASASATTSA